ANILPAGQMVSVVGFPRAGEVRPQLLDAIVKELDETKNPMPVSVSPEQVLERALDGELVRVEARLANLLERPGNSILLLQSERTTFNARLLDPQPITDALQTNSWVEVTGICVLEGTAVNDPGSFTLIVRELSDVRVLQNPPWWTPEGVRQVVLVMALLVGAVALWVIVLRRKVGQQTAMIADRIEMERISEERARIARELHDTLEQELVGIKMALDTVDSRIESAPQRARRALDQARAMIRRSQSEARQSVWDLRAANLAHAELDEAVRELILPLNETDGIHIEVETDVKHHPSLDGVAKNHILRIAQESVTNAMKHAAAKVIVLKLKVSDAAVNLAVHDDGTGFDVSESPAQTGHFGLIGMRERAGKLGGQLTIESDGETGTTIRLSVPLNQPSKT
ncbi:MAG: sensor histidine kinase, partial [Limisphaerales bacterium]